jgi:uncharacterized Zn-binding protein involved in type VI secretion
MGEPVAKKDDRVVGIDTHIVMITTPGGQVPTPLPNPFSGPIKNDLASSVYADDKKVAVVGSGAENSPKHVASGGQFQKDPSNKAKIKKGSSTVFAGGTAIARNNDPAECCNDPSDQQTGHVVASGSVHSG